MRRSTFTASQIVGLLKEADAGVPVSRPVATVALRLTLAVSRGGARDYTRRRRLHGKLGIAPGCCRPNWANRHQIVVGDFAQIVRMQGYQGLCAA